MSGRNERFVHFENVCKYYNNKTIIAADHVTFDIAEGEFVVIVGPSGAGKTTILNMLGGMDTCDEGVISLGDRVISGATKRQLTEYRRTDVGLAVCAAVKKLAKTGKKEEKLTKKELPYTLAMIILDIAAPILLNLFVAVPWALM